MISNLGKGDLNNGLTIYLYDKQKKQEYLKPSNIPIKN